MLSSKLHLDRKKGYTAKEISQFEIFLSHNAHLFYKYAKEGGIKIA
jgi:hypothetical protein